jgi:DNA polymerase III delta prime subunit
MGPGTEGLLGMRKLKRNVVRISDEEDLILRASLQLSKRTVNLSAELEHAEAFRVPERLLTTGVDVANMVCKELHAQIPKLDEDELATRQVHPALTSVFSDIEKTLTPFDKGECETLAWTQKYAPRSASEVLLPGKEAVVLRDWLKSLTVVSVEVAGKPKGRPDLRQRPPKKKRKKDMDDFIVSEGDDDKDDDAMDELTDPEDMPSRDSRLGHQKSLIRISRQDASDDSQSTRRKNAVLLSGPHGCGKTAIVYAVAKELGFEIFEINPGTRRSGKDILDKVGDMTENHLVNHNKPSEQKTTLKATEAVDSDQDRVAEALQKDLDSGRQGTMTSFFKSVGKAKAPPKVKATVTAKESPKASTTLQSTILKPRQRPQNQMQSLILLEEVDILFKEDESFWSTVIKLATQSKRPIVMTCNDESLVAINAMPLHAILRLCPPSVDLAADYLLLLAAREGHLLERKAIRDLYISKDHDLRASITDLDFWCQMSVGDRKGGLEWIYQRWPPGKDVDEHGRFVRVASKGTYKSGMGWLSHDVFKSTESLGFDKEEEILSEAWNMWGIRPDCWAHPPKDHLETSDLSTIQALRHLEDLLDCISAADTYCRVGLPFDTEVSSSSHVIATNTNRVSGAYGSKSTARSTPRS